MSTVLGRRGQQRGGRPEPASGGVYRSRAPRSQGARVARRLLRQSGPRPARAATCAPWSISQRSRRPKAWTCEARRRNPTGQGIHNKMVLAQIGGQGWAVVGSLNGGEVSAKLNREMALLVGSDKVYTYLADVFWYDWDVTP